MKLVIQRVKHASVTIDGEVVGKICQGFMVLAGIAQTDTEEIADKMINKMCKLRIFEDENGKTNLSLSDVGGEVMLISQFTLYANTRRGNRPSFIEAGSPDMASPLYDHMIQECGKYVENVAKGEFGADMKVELLNDGPFTIVMDSDELTKPRNQ